MNLLNKSLNNLTFKKKSWEISDSCTQFNFFYFRDKFHPHAVMYAQGMEFKLYM